jgi:phosphatidylserine/phosphatidylglycerophosphate/cardiolipin synthase-like enzyme
MKHKIFQLIVISAFFVLFGYFYGEEFWQYQESQQQEKIYQENLNQDTNDFSIENIASLENTELWLTPNLPLLDDIVSQIDQAEKRVYLEVYIFTERDMRDAIIRAHNRGVEVKVLLENNPYKAPYLNDSHYRDLESAGVNVTWSDPLNYSLNHAKLLIIDDSAYVSTGNFSYSLFKYNRDLLLRIFDREFVNVLVALFL